MRSAALLLLLLLPAQDAGRIAIDRSGSITEVAQALSEASGTTVRVLDGVDPKNFTVRTEPVSFFEALDAVCRAHGQVSYLAPPRGPDEGLVELRSGRWAEFPSAYSPDFKVIVSEIAGFNADTLVGEQRWNRVYLSLFGAPWVRVQDAPGSKAVWTLDEALDADGKDVRIPPRDPEPAQSIDLVWHGRFTKGNAASRVFRLRPFDPDKGLQSLKGSVQVSIANTKEIELPLAAGKSVDTPAGTLVVDAVREPDANAPRKSWRVALTLKDPKRGAGLRQAFEPRFRCSGDELKNRVYQLNFPKDGASFEAEISGATALPGSIRLMARDGERRATIPFEFKNLRF